MIHTIFWFTTLLLVGLETIPSMDKFTYDIIATDYLLYVISFFTLFYSFYFFIKRDHLNKKRIRALILFGLLFVLLINIPITYIYVFFLAKEIFNLKGNAFLLDFAKYYMSFLETNFLFAMSGSLMKIALLWYDNVMKQKEMEKQLVMGELALLKSQINPQFLFNTLTYIRAMIETQPEKAIYSIEILSEIMSYMLYRTNAEKVILNDEIDNVNNYLTLQKVRYKTDLISFEVLGNRSRIMVPPMVFIPIIENIFWSVDHTPKPPAISMKLIVEESVISFEINYYLRENLEEEKYWSGNRIKSIQRFLDLQLGSNNYNLEIKSENNKYFIKLRIIL